ncbi:hypothetical protein LCGC14_2395630 [marine sediment metagenome]|uniref:Uncharacterized protein n=1 Tax=marine sediment metagenome TaxID=412755 RepID=A0A0F9ERA5_9ZZZZ
MAIIPATDFVLGDEKAVYLYEMNLLSPLGQRRRYEIIWVVRDDKKTEYRRDLGKVTEDAQIRLPSYMEHTVKELREMANQLRSVPLLDPREICGNGN